MTWLKRRELFFFHQPGCQACATAQPVIEAWASRHYAEVLVVPVDLTMYDGPKYGFVPKATPAYLYAEDGEEVRSHIGSITKTKDLDALVSED